MPGVVDTTHTFATNEVITSTLMNNIIDETLFTSDALSGGTLALVAGKMKVATSGITSNELAVNAVTTNAIAANAVTTNAIAANAATYAKLQKVTSMRVLGNTSGSLSNVSEVSVLNESDMSSNSATGLATQQSIKAYVDANSLQLGTALTATSNTAFSFTGIPSTARKVIINFYNLSSSGTSPIIARIGDSTYAISGYVGSASEIKGTPAAVVFTNGFGISPSPLATDSISGIMTICNVDQSYWVASFSAGNSAVAQVYSGGGSIFLGGALDRVQITTSGGTDTFDNGIVNIMYE